MLTASPVDEAEHYHPAVTRYIRYLIRDSADAEDLAQETFLRAHQQRETLRDRGALESWLYQIATHVSIDRMRQRARSATRMLEKPAEDLPIVDQKRSPFTIVQQSEMSSCVQLYVAKLSDAYRAVLLLHDADGLTAEEIANLLQLPLTTVKCACTELDADFRRPWTKPVHSDATNGVFIFVSPNRRNPRLIAVLRQHSPLPVREH